MSTPTPDQPATGPAVFAAPGEAAVAGPPAHGHRVQGAVSGLVFGLGVAILLQQFAIVPLTLLLLVLVPLGGALVGVGLGWPRGGPR